MITPDMLAPGEAIAVDMSEAEYFADRIALTRSALGLLPDKPIEFGAWVRGEDVQREPSDDMRLGTAAHLAILEPERFSSLILPKPPKPKNASKKAAAGTPERMAYETWSKASAIHDHLSKANPHALTLTESEIRRLFGMREAIARHPVASALFGGHGSAEQTIVWREPSTGLLVKVRVDWLTRLSAADLFGTDLDPGLYANDLKTTLDDAPWPFSRSVKKYGYLPQAAIYSDAIEAWASEPVRWAWIAVTSDSCSNGMHGASVYLLTEEQRARGREIYMRQLVEALDRLSRDDWTPAHRVGFSTLPI